jgi:hypothetical protein
MSFVRMVVGVEGSSVMDVPRTGGTSTAVEVIDAMVVLVLVDGS